MGHAERVAQRLLERYRRNTLSECQHAVARMYGHPDWAALQAAVAEARITPSDEDSTADRVQARRAHQRDAALIWLAGVTDEVARAAEDLERSLLTPAAHTITQRYDPRYNHKRMDRARYVYNVAFARAAVDEIRPSSGETMDIPRDDDEVELMLRVDLLPRAVKTWLMHHRPLLARRAHAIGGMRVRQRSRTDLLDFSFAWGELCLLHGADIPKALQIYPIALCAQWHAWLECLASAALQADIAMIDAPHATDAQRRQAQQALNHAVREQEARFVLAQPREDFRSLSASARQQQIHAGHAALRRYMGEAAAEKTIKTILAKPSWLALTAAVRAS